MRLYEWYKQLSLFLLLLFLSGCGFHLRGMGSVPSWFTNVAIVVEQAHRDLAPLLKEQLQAYKVNVNTEPALAGYWLIIESDSIQQNIAGVSSSTTPRQYQLTYTVRFKLQRAKGKEMIPESVIVVSRQVTINANRILGSNEEEALLEREMRQDAVIQMINRISRELTKADLHHAN